MRGRARAGWVPIAGCLVAFAVGVPAPALSIGSAAFPAVAVGAPETRSAARAGDQSVPVAPIRWAGCPGQASYRCGTVEVPIDYAAPRRGSIAIAVIDRPASGPGSTGSLLFNPGGPGQSGVQVLPIFANLFPAALRDHFDLVSFDERGTGASSKLNCGPTPAAAASAAPAPVSARGPLPAASVFASMAAACRQQYPQLIDHIDSIDAARDLDRIRQALGVPTISYWGVSYGTVLGAQYARLFPSRVRSMVLDGAVVPTETLALQAKQEAPALAASLDHFFATCAAAGSCPLGADPRAGFDALAVRLAAHPLPSPTDGVPVTAGDLETDALFYLTVPAFAGSFLPALAAASQGDGTMLRALAVQFETDIDGSSDIGPLWAYTCNDAADRPTPRAAGNLARTLAKSYPPIGGFSVTYLLAGCLHWPAAPQPVRALRYAGRNPIVVIGNTGDPNTPHVAAVLLARALGNAHLVTWRGFGHTWLLNGNSDPCVTPLVTTYLVAGHPPRDQTVC